MSFATLEREILAGAKDLLKNPKLKKADILEWSSGTVSPREGEICIRIPGLAVNACVLKKHDLREVSQ